MDKEQVQKWKLYDKIVARAEAQMGRKYAGLSRLSLLMDIELADQKFHLRLKDWLESDELNFTHDWNGIHNHIDRQKKVFDKTFVPRFAEGGM